MSESRGNNEAQMSEGNRRIQVFISHSSIDKDLASQVSKLLESHGLSCWIAPKGIREGQKWAEELVKNLHASDVLLVLLTKHCVESRHTLREVILADQQNNMKVIPLYTPQVKLTGAWQYFLCDRHWRNIIAPPSLEEHMTKVAEAVKMSFGEVPIVNAGENRGELLSMVNRPGNWVPLRMPLRIPQKNRSLKDQRTGLIQPSSLVNASTAFIPLIGRESELEKLAKFRNGADLFSWAVVKGEGGTGKTRLATEFCKMCAKEGWQSGFLEKDQLERFLGNQTVEKWRPLVPTFIIIDYAAAKVENASKLINLLINIAYEQESGSSPNKVRLLLIEREASQDSGWLHSILTSAAQNVRLDIEQSFNGDWLLSHDPNKFTAMKPIIEATMDAWSGLEGKLRPDLDLREDQWKKIQTATTNRPLYLQLAAIYACEENDAHALYHVSRTDLLETAVNWETIYIEKLCRDENLATAVKYISGLLCLTGLSVLRDPNWYRCVRTELDAIGKEHINSSTVSDTRDRVFPDTKTDNDNNDSDRSAIQPDILAAAFCCHVFRKEQMGFRMCCHRALALGGIRAWPKLLRMVQDLQGLKGYENIAAEVSCLLEDRPIKELDQLVDDFPDRSASLHRIAEKLFQVLINDMYEISDGSKKRVKTDKRQRFAKIAVQWITYAAEPGRMGGKIKADIELGLQAIEILMIITEEDRETNEPLLAKAHHYLASCLDHWPTNSPEWSDCPEHNNRAIQIRRKLYESNQEKFALDLADSLNNRSNYLSGIKNYEDALGAIQEAVSIAENISKHAQSMGMARIGRYYNVCGQRLETLGRHEEALGYLKKSYEMRGELYRRDADIHAAPYSRTLTNYWKVLLECKETEKAMQVLDTEIHCNMELSRRKPLPYLKWLVYPCLRRAAYYCKNDEVIKAAELIKDVGMHMLRLHLVQPCWDVAQTAIKRCMEMVNNLSGDAFADTTKTLLEEIIVLAGNYREEPDAMDFLKKANDLLLKNLVVQKHSLKSGNEAEVFLEWYDNCSIKSESVPLRATAQVANKLGLDRFDPKNASFALRLMSIAAEAYTKLSEYDTDPGLLLDKVDTINNLSYMQMTVGDIDKALCTAKQALSLLGDQEGFKPHKFALVHTRLLDTYAQILLRAGDTNDAGTIAGEAIAICREQNDNPQCSLGPTDLMFGLLTKARIHLVAGESDDARANFSDAMAQCKNIKTLSIQHYLCLKSELSWFEANLPGLDSDAAQRLIDRSIEKYENPA